MRQKRQTQILRIISENDIKTQEQLTDSLKKLGYDTTQATVSRDINELQLIKIAGSGKKYRYAQVTQGKSIDNAKFLTLFKAAVVSIEAAQNIIVVKTLISNANPVAATVDSLGYHEIVGSVAGDDTLLIVTHNNEEAANVVAKLNALL